MTRRHTAGDVRAGAEGVAIAALGFLASDPERLGRFLSLTGLGPDNLRAAAAEPAFLRAVLDHVAADERLLLAFAADAEIDPERIVDALAILSAGEPGEG